MSIQSIAVASAKSFGDFVIVHSVLHRIEKNVKARIRLIACSHLRGLNAILPSDVGVTLVDSGEDRVPALFDFKKCGAAAAVQSALSLRRRFQEIERDANEVLAFDVLGVRERFIAGRWPVISPRTRGPNIYETYSQFLAEQEIRTAAARSPIHAGAVRSVGIFPESRLAEKRLGAPTLSVILDRAARAGLDAKLFILDGDLPPQREYRCVVNISRNFESLANAIRSVDSVISADSLPAHLGEYFDRPVFVASPAPNEYWLPHACFTNKRWGIFGNQAQFSSLLDRFLAESRAA
jgi:ADP-heptose:LPS heptosyltransferase